jgi:peptidoglycan/LPS O-acetylase OafA/YrhL
MSLPIAESPLAAAATPRAPAAAERGRFYRPELDGLRFVAFLAVYLNHTLAGGEGVKHHHLSARLGEALGVIGTAGAFGVDLFFVLSAFLISELLLREREATGHLDVRRFYVRRMLRIWPLYFFFLAIAFALTRAVPTEQLSWYHLAAFLLFSGNWAYILKPVTTVAAPLWSVSVEEQFYLCWPWLVRRSSVARMAAMAGAIVAGGIALRYGLGREHLFGDWIGKNSLTRIDGIAGGILLCLALRSGLLQLSSFQRRVLFLGSLAILFWVAGDFGLFHAQTSLDHLMLGWPLVALGCTGIVAAIIDGEGVVVRLLRSPLLTYLGRLSYGLYVFHELGLLIADHVFAGGHLTAARLVEHWLFGLGLTFAFAALSYRFIEQPFLRLKERRYTVVASRPEGAGNG